MKLPHRRQFLHLATGAAALPFAPHCKGASVSVAAGAHCRRLCPRRRGRHLRASDRPMAVGAARPTVYRRKQDGGRHQYRCGGGRTCSAGWLYPPPRAHDQRVYPALYERLSFNFVRDIAPVATFARVPNVLEVNPSVAPRRSPNSSRLQSLIRARSTWAPPATVQRIIWPPSYSR